MFSVAEVYSFLAAHEVVTGHAEAPYLVNLFSDLAAGNFEKRGPKEDAKASVLLY